MTLRRSLFWFAVGFVATCLWLGFAYSHPGGLDSYGCHHNRKQGGYHCHRGQFASQSFQSKEEMLKKLSAGKTGAKKTTTPKQ